MEKATYMMITKMRVKCNAPTLNL